jgi:hypothetical protein
MDRRIRELAQQKATIVSPAIRKALRTSTIGIAQLLLSGGSARRSS